MHHNVVAALLALILTIGPIRGYATHYDLGLFEQVRRNRGLPRADCYTSSDWHELGSFVEIEGLRTGVRRVCQVTDVSASPDRARHMRVGLVELDYQSARALCGRAFRSRWRECPVVVRTVQVVQVQPQSVQWAYRSRHVRAE
jgi:hypothetical protein